MSLRAKKKQRDREDILAAAEKLINAKGYDKATMKDIALEAEVSYQTLYNYFPNKAFIVQVMMMQDIEVANRKIGALIEAYRSDPLELIYSMAKTQLDMVSQRDRFLWREFVVEYIKQARELVAAYNQTDAAAHERIQHALTMTQERGHLDPSVNVEVLASALYNIGDMAFLSYIIQPKLTKQSMLQNFRAQLELIIAPYLTDRSRIT